MRTPQGQCGPSVKSSLSNPVFWLQITNACNLRCTHCYADSSPDEPVNNGESLDKWAEMLRYGRASGRTALQITGGEPTLHLMLRDIVDSAFAMGYREVEVFTNGTALDDALIGFFAERDVSIATSVFSADARENGLVTGDPASLGKTLSAVSKAVSTGIPVRVVVTRIFQDVETLVRLEAVLKRIGVGRVDVTEVLPRGRGRNLSLSRLSAGCRAADKCAFRGMSCSGLVCDCICNTSNLEAVS